MSWLRFFRRGRADAELRSELESYVEEETAENVARGMTPEEARRRARVKLGSAQRVRETVWRQNTLLFFDSVGRDLGYALRTLRRNRGFALTAILILALGIGANTAIFSLMNAVLLRSLPVDDPSSLVRLTMNVQMGSRNIQNVPINYPILEFLARHAKSFRGVFGWSDCDFVLSRNGVVRLYHGAIVSGNTFNVLGVRPALGRLLTAQDDQTGGGPDGWTGVISYRLWMTAFQGDPAVIGSNINLADHSVRIVGVTPAGFEGVIVADRPDFYLPLSFEPVMRGAQSQLHTSASLWLTGFARLGAGVSERQAGAEMAVLLPSMFDAILPPAVRHLPFIEHSRLVVESGRTGWSFLRPEYTRALMLMQCMVAILLLVGCANLSGLCLARASARQKEFAIRGALGAAPGRLLRQVLAESLLLAVTGAALGIALAWPAARFVVQHLGNRGVAQSLSTRPDATVLLVTAACAIACAIFFGMAPAWQARRTSLEPVLRQASSQSRRAGLRSVLIPLEVGLSLVLVVLAGLLGATIVQLRAQNPGFHTENVLFAEAEFDRLPEKGRDLADLYLRMQQRMEQMPGIEAASVARLTPLSGSVASGSFAAAGEARFTIANINEIGPHYFAAIGTPILVGHGFTAQDMESHECVLNQAAAERYFPNGAALGHTLSRSELQAGNGAESRRDCVVVGVSADAKYASLRDAVPPVVYLPIDADTYGLSSLSFVLHGRDDAAARRAYQAVLHEMAPGAPEAAPISFAQQYDNSVARDQLLSQLSGFFAVLALLLSGIGIYGLVAWRVAERTAEIGIRMALGASRRGILTCMLRQLLFLLVAGLVLGGAAAWFAAHAIRGFLFGVAPNNPFWFMLAAAAVIITAIIAAMLPARRAASIDPMQALRME
jgi:putative ABC transport system permease protein